MLTIGRLGRLAGLEPKTLRYYDRVGLLRPATRTPTGYRLYDDDALVRLRFIRRAKSLGMSLADIRRILAFRDEGAAPCQHVLDLVQEHIRQVEAHIHELQALRLDLGKVQKTLKRNLPQDEMDACRCVEIISFFNTGRNGDEGS